MGRTGGWQRREALKAMAATAAAWLGAGLRADEAKGLPEQIVDAMNAIFGKHSAFRSAHAKGVVCEGEFVASASAATLSKAPHLRPGDGAAPVKVTVRFSDSTGLPDVPDGATGASPHGMALKFHLPGPGNGSTDIVANAFNGFAVANGDDFLAFLRAVAESGPGAAKPTPLDGFLAAHPEAAKVV